jgi:glyoxylase-like metal-dependent hydrolase (beta-lactamase superfamily II)
MSLEDHLGDIVGKGRRHAGISAADAAAAAGLTVAELEALEESGTTSKPLGYARLGGLIGLDAAKLEDIAGGWEPQTVDLARWRRLRWISTAGGGWPVNSYLVWDEVTRDAALFDTGYEADEAFRLIDENALQLRYLFITHGHSDHVAALPQIQGRFPNVRIRSSDRSAPPDQRNRPDDSIQLGSLQITNRDTPGHADDGVTYVIGAWPDDAPHVAVVGDAIFAGSMGRAVGNTPLARRKVQEQILSLPEATLICPGHGPLTTVAEEKAHNPFF